MMPPPPSVPSETKWGTDAPLASTFRPMSVPPLAAKTPTAPPAGLLLGQFVAVVVVLAVLRPPFVMGTSHGIHLPRFNPKAAFAVAAISVAATYAAVKKKAV